MAVPPVHPRGTRAPLIVVGTLLLVLTAACGGSEGTGETSAGTSSQASPSAPAAQTSSAPPSGDAGAGAEQVVLRISDFAFEVPPSVPAGAEVTVVNEDSSFHTVTADDGTFDVEAPSGTVTFTAPDEPGEYPFSCRPHPNMTGTLVVT
jgi:plastocyanin